MTETYSPLLDRHRLSGLLSLVVTLMLDGEWRTLGEIQGFVGHSEAGISARLRELRQHDFRVAKRRRGEGRRGLWEYQVRKPLPAGQLALEGV